MSDLELRVVESAQLFMNLQNILHPVIFYISCRYWEVHHPRLKPRALKMQGTVNRLPTWCTWQDNMTRIATHTPRCNRRFSRRQISSTLEIRHLVNEIHEQDALTRPAVLMRLNWSSIEHILWISISEGRETLTSGSPPSQGLRSWLQEIGGEFDLTRCWHMTKEDWQRKHFCNATEGERPKLPHSPIASSQLIWSLSGPWHQQSPDLASRSHPVHDDAEWQFHNPRGSLLYMMESDNVRFLNCQFSTFYSCRWFGHRSPNLFNASHDVSPDTRLNSSHN